MIALAALQPVAPIFRAAVEMRDGNHENFGFAH
jgi:hypothetical protein